MQHSLFSTTGLVASSGIL